MTDHPYTEADVERVAVKLHETFEPLAGDVLIFEDCLELARLAIATDRGALAAAGRLLPEGARAHGICGEHAPTLFGAGLDRCVS